jgi:Demerecviridae HNH endonuclease
MPAKRPPAPSKATLKAIANELRYDPKTGHFWWLRNGSGRNFNVPAGSLNVRGYIRITVFGRQYASHILAWFFITGKYPAHHIDHINRVKTDNSAANLRKITPQQNCANRGIPSSNTSGAKGVFFNKNGWQVRCEIGGKAAYLGRFRSRDEAAAAYDKYAKSKLGDFYFSGRPSDPKATGATP